MSERASKINLVLTLVALALLVVLLAGSRNTLGDTYQLLKGLDWRLLALLPLFQLSSHVFVALTYKSFLQALGHTVPFARTLPMVWALNFVNLILPSGGMSGLTYLIYGLRGLVPAGKATLAQLARYLLSYFSYAFVLVVAFIFLAAANSVTPRSITFVVVLAGASVIVAIVFGYILSNPRRVDRFVHGLHNLVDRMIRWFRRSKSQKPSTIARRLQGTLDEFHGGYRQISKHRRKLLVPFLFMIVSTAFENAIVYMSFVALGVTVNPGVVLISFSIANAVGVLSVVPGDVGVHEAAMIGALSAVGVPPATALSATLLYRVFNKVLYLPIGFVAYSRLLKPAVKQSS